MLMVRSAALDEIVDLRHRVLREGLPRESAVFPGDELSTSLHLAMFDGDRAVCCATFHPEPWFDEPAWRLRGMATDAAYRGRGCGRAVLDRAEEELRQRDPQRLQLWCNARLVAVRFYQSLGWSIVSPLFDIPTAGPHHQMVKRVREIPQPA